jgi:hypothetical protein
MKRTIAAFLFAPLVPPLLFWAVIPLLFHSQDHWPTLADLPGFMIYGGVITYLATVIVGVPAYCLIRTYARLRAEHVLSISAAVGAAVMSLTWGNETPLLIALGALLGLSAGVTFWLIWRRNAV